LDKLLKEKHDQLDFDGHQGILIVANEGCYAHARDVVDACAFIDFSRYPNVDKIYFEEVQGKFQLVYDREAWYAMEARKLPKGGEARVLVVGWLEVRLAKKSLVLLKPS